MLSYEMISAFAADRAGSLGEPSTTSNESKGSLKQKQINGRNFLLFFNFLSNQNCAAMKYIGGFTVA